MFNNYKIVEVGGKKTLILYIDTFFEFGIDFNNHHKYSNMKNTIKEIIKKINFNGEKIALMIGGILLAGILIIENPKTLDGIDLIYVNSNIIPKSNISLVVDKKIENIVEKEIKEVKLVDEEKIDINKKEFQKSKNIEIKDIDKEKKEIVEEKKDLKQETIENETKVTVYRSNGKIDTLDLEEYLIGVVGAEMPASFNIEALKVQAIISRTYALKSLETNRKLTDTVSTQVYNDNNQLKIKFGNDYDKYYHKIKEAVDSTKSMAIYYNNKLIDAVFFSTSNGKTEDSKYVWGNSIPYLKSVDSSWDVNTTPYLRSEEKDLLNVLNILGISNANFSIVSRDDSGRVLEISADNKIFTGVEFRNLLGLRSADFDIDISNDKIAFTTRGYGHGVGLSQYGSNMMANNGHSYIEIIKHYYTGVEIK